MNYLLFLFLLLGSCATTFDVVMLGDGTTRRAFKGKVEVFGNPDSVKRPYREIALITADDEGNGKTNSELVEELRSKSASIGAQAIILKGTKKHSDGAVAVPIGGTLVFVPTDSREVSCIAIEFTN